MHKYIAIAVGAFLLSGCTTVSVYPTSLGKSGMEYALPKPILVIYPDPAGGGAFKSRVDYIANEDNTYDIVANSYLSKHTLQVDLKNRLLTLVTSNADDSTLAKAAVETGAAVAGSALDAQKARKEKEASDAAAQQAAAKQVKSGAEADAAAKKLTYDQAVATRQELEATLDVTNPDHLVLIAQARAAEQVALVAWKAAQSRVESLTNTPVMSASMSVISADGSVESLSNDPQSLSERMNDPDDKDLTVLTHAYSPVAYAVDEVWDESNKKSQLSLKASRYTSEYKTQSLIQTSKFKVEKPEPPTPDTVDEPVELKKSGEQYVGRLNLTVKVASIVFNEALLVNPTDDGDGATTIVTAKLEGNGKVVSIAAPGTLAPGKFQLRFRVITGSDKEISLSAKQGVMLVSH